MVHYLLNVHWRNVLPDRLCRAYGSEMQKEKRSGKRFPR